MENTKPSNQPAFPNGKQIQICEQGMTLRDYFAAKAMQGMISNPSMFDMLGGNANEVCVRHSFELADAMLKQREL